MHCLCKAVLEYQSQNAIATYNIKDKNQKAGSIRYIQLARRNYLAIA